MRRALATLLTLALLGGSWAGWRAHVRLGASAVPTFAVTRQSFARRVTAEGNLRAVTRTPVTVPQIEGMWGALTIAWLAHDGTAVHAGDVVVRFDRATAETALREAQSTLAMAEAQLRAEQIRATASAREHAAAATLTAQQAQQIRQFKAIDPKLYSRNQIIEADLDEKLATARQLQAERAKEIDLKVSHSEVELYVIRRQRAQLAVAHATTALANLEVKAPQDGILVLQRDDHGDVPKLGARLWPSQPIAELPTLATMEAELFVLEVDGSGLEEGQPADVIVESHPDRVFHGKIRLVDKLAKPRDLGSPVQYFSVVVALDVTDPVVMKPGQRVRAALVLDHQDTFPVPRQAVFEKDGKALVYRRAAHGFTPVEVQLGAATAGRIAVTAGLAEGDVIAERDPTRALDQPAGSGSATPAPGVTP